MSPTWIVIAGAVIIVLAAIIVAVGRHDKPAAAAAPPPGTLPHTPGTYLGVYAAHVPLSYAGVTAFTSGYRGHARRGHVLQRVV